MENKYIACNECFSTDIVKTREGFVCRNCGIIFSNDTENTSNETR